MANDAGQVKVLGEKSKQKHEMITSGLRGLITAQPAVLTNAHSAAADAPLTATATEPEPAPLTTPEAAAAIESNEDYDPDEQGSGRIGSFRSVMGTKAAKAARKCPI